MENGRHLLGNITTAFPRFSAVAGLRRDSLEEEQHTVLKRWERGALYKAIRRREEEGNFLLPCRWKSDSNAAVLFQTAQLLEIFPGDFSVVRFAGDSGKGVCLLRDGLPWDRCYPLILQAYLQGTRVPKPFKPARRIPPDLIRKALTWPFALQSQFFEELRKTGMLPVLKKLDAQAVSPWFPWEEARVRFMDFKEEIRKIGNVTDIPPKELNIPGPLWE